MSAPYIQNFTVSFRYEVYFTERLFAAETTALRDVLARDGRTSPRRLLAVIDSGVLSAWPKLPDDLASYARAHGDVIEWAASPVVVTGGEQAKNDPRELAMLLERLERDRMDRHAYVLAIGGGAVLDLACYAAAITHRGVRAIRVPTTVLAQADSGVGVKNGVNAFGKKNFWGTFTPPYAVLNDSHFLRTLSPRDRIAGMAEAVKVALVRDRDLFEWLDAHAEALHAGDERALGTLVRRCAERHLQHIAGAGDPFEQGSARPLDYGHWSAHKLERMTAHRLRHGEAVAIGIAIDSLYAARIGMLSEVEAARICTLLQRLGFRLWDAALAEVDSASGTAAVLAGLEDFREHLGGELNVPLLTAIGCARETFAMDFGVVDAVLRELAAKDADARSARP